MESAANVVLEARSSVWVLALAAWNVKGTETPDGKREFSIPTPIPATMSATLAHWRTSLIALEMAASHLRAALP